MNRAQKKATETKTIETIYTSLSYEVENLLERLEVTNKEFKELLEEENPDKYDLEFMNHQIEEQEIRIKTYNKVLEALHKMM